MPLVTPTGLVALLSSLPDDAPVPSRFTKETAMPKDRSFTLIQFLYPYRLADSYYLAGQRAEIRDWLADRLVARRIAKYVQQEIR